MIEIEGGEEYQSWLFGFYVYYCGMYTIVMLMGMIQIYIHWQRSGKKWRPIHTTISFVVIAMIFFTIHGYMALFGVGNAAVNEFVLMTSFAFLTEGGMGLTLQWLIICSMDVCNSSTRKSLRNSKTRFDSFCEWTVRVLYVIAVTLNVLAGVSRDKGDIDDYRNLTRAGFTVWVSIDPIMMYMIISYGNRFVTLIKQSGQGVQYEKLSNKIKVMMMCLNSVAVNYTILLVVFIAAFKEINSGKIYGLLWMICWLALLPFAVFIIQCAIGLGQRKGGKSTTDSTHDSRNVSGETYASNTFNRQSTYSKTNNTTTVSFHFDHNVDQEFENNLTGSVSLHNLHDTSNHNTV